MFKSFHQFPVGFRPRLNHCKTQSKLFHSNSECPSHSLETSEMFSSRIVLCLASHIFQSALTSTSVYQKVDLLPDVLCVPYNVIPPCA